MHQSLAKFSESEASNHTPSLVDFTTTTPELKFSVHTRTCPGCGALLILALPPGGNGKRTFQCLDCERPDPLKTDQAIGWLKGELQPPK